MKYPITHLILLLTSLLSCTVNAADVNIRGRLVASPCVVDLASVSQDVDFGRVQKKDLKVAGSASDWQSFNVKLLRCPTSTRSVTATFSGQPFSGDATLYSNAGSAEGVAIQLVQDGDKAKVLGNTTSMSVNVDAQHNVVYALAARLISPVGLAGAGAVSGVVQINFTYQ